MPRPCDLPHPSPTRNVRVCVVPQIRRLVPVRGPNLPSTRHTSSAAVIRWRNVETTSVEKGRDARTETWERHVRIDECRRCRSNVVFGRKNLIVSSQTQTHAHIDLRSGRSSATMKTTEHQSRSILPEIRGQVIRKRRGSAWRGKSSPLAVRVVTKGSGFPWISISWFRCPPFVAGLSWASLRISGTGRFERGAYESTLDRRFFIVVLCIPFFASISSRASRRLRIPKAHETRLGRFRGVQERAWLGSITADGNSWKPAAKKRAKVAKSKAWKRGPTWRHARAVVKRDAWKHPWKGWTIGKPR